MLSKFIIFPYKCTQFLLVRIHSQYDKDKFPNMTFSFLQIFGKTAFLERIGLKKGAELMFVLSTQTMQWFIERGFDAVSVDDLPPSRQETYNHERKSKIYMKSIDGTKDLDQEELMWDNGDVV